MTYINPAGIYLFKVLVIFNVDFEHVIAGWDGYLLKGERGMGNGVNQLPQNFGELAISRCSIH